MVYTKPTMSCDQSIAIDVVLADYSNEEHKRLIPLLLDEYARDPMGGGAPLGQRVKRGLVEQLNKRAFAFTVLAFVDEAPAGLANCFEGFSTFACEPLINIHDIVVSEQFRGNGVSQAMLGKIEEIALAKNCCKITLEVLNNNHIAKSAYKKFGFAGYELDPSAGEALFWQKDLLTEED